MGNGRLVEVAAVTQKCSVDAPIESESTESVFPNSVSEPIPSTLTFTSPLDSYDSDEDEVSLPTNCLLPPPPGLGYECELFTPAQIHKIRESECRDFE